MAEYQYADFRIWGLAGFSRMITNLKVTGGEHPYSRFYKSLNEDFKQLTGKNISIGTSTGLGTKW